MNGDPKCCCHKFSLQEYWEYYGEREEILKNLYEGRQKSIELKTSLAVNNAKRLLLEITISQFDHLNDAQRKKVLGYFGFYDNLDAGVAELTSLLKSL